MYNRYIPQSDGTYRRSRVAEPPPPSIPCREEPAPPCPTPREPVCQANACPRMRQRPSQGRQERKSQSAGSFLKNLLPEGFDTSDLIIVLLLLLMAGDRPEDRSTALLTLALYFLM